ncbi:MAG: hypothetical protein AAGA80_24265 [Cyanobacteria bacterium P01_F01_bin.143]
MNTFSAFPAFAQQPDCANYWTNPNTEETECFNGEMNLIAEPKPVSSQAQPLSYRSSLPESYDLGGKEITIPTPDKYVRVTREMDAVYRLHSHMEDPLNDFLASYISQSDAAIAMGGEIPLLERGFALKMVKVFKEMSVSSQDFAEIKNEVKTYNESISASGEPKLREIVNETGEGISKELGIDFSLNLSQMIPLEPHYESENVLSYSLYMIYEVSEGGVQEEYVLAATATLINVSGKVISLYSYGTQSDLEWTQNSSKAWAKKVVASN